MQSACNPARVPRAPLMRKAIRYAISMQSSSSTESSSAQASSCARDNDAKSDGDEAGARDGAAEGNCARDGVTEGNCARDGAAEGNCARDAAAVGEEDVGPDLGVVGPSLAGGGAVLGDRRSGDGGCARWTPVRNCTTAATSAVRHGSACPLGCSCTAACASSNQVAMSAWESCGEEEAPW